MFLEVEFIRVLTLKVSRCCPDPSLWSMSDPYLQWRQYRIGSTGSESYDNAATCCLGFMSEQRPGGVILGFYLVEKQDLNGSYLRAFISHICPTHYYFPPHLIFGLCVCVFAHFNHNHGVLYHKLNVVSFNTPNTNDQITKRKLQVCLLSYLINCCLGSF